MFATHGLRIALSALLCVFISMGWACYTEIPNTDLLHCSTDKDCGEGKSCRFGHCGPLTKDAQAPTEQAPTETQSPEKNTDASDRRKPLCKEGDTRLCAPRKDRDTGDCPWVKRCKQGQWSPCVNELKPTAEVCDGKDNNCDGLIDENCACQKGQKQRCGTSQGVCRPGTQSCVQGQWGPCEGSVLPTAEICDEKDNDCDGKIDEQLSRVCFAQANATIAIETGCGFGRQVCDRGKWKECTLSQKIRGEACDGKDNDCDGLVDEALVKLCGNPQGQCKQGLSRCEKGQWSTCQGAVGPKKESCDGEDNDCDGLVDEGCSCQPGQTQSCGSIKGSCLKGTQRCGKKGWGSCIRQRGPSREVCDGKDNDCNGLIDEQVTSKSCNTGKPGLCNAGMTSCQSGKQRCVSLYQATTERCDGRDNNCDGKVDEGCPCLPSKLTMTIRSTSSHFQSISFHPNGRQLLTSSQTTLQLWDIKTKKAVRTFKAHTALVTTAAFNQSGTQFISGDAQQQLKLWDTNTGKVRQRFLGHTAAIKSVVFFPDDQRIASGSIDGQIKVWEIKTGKTLRTITNAQNKVSNLAISKDGQWLLGYFTEGTIRIWNASTGRLLHINRSSDAGSSTAAMSPDKKSVIFETLNNDIQLWRIGTSKSLYFYGHHDIIHTLTWAPHGRYFASGARDKKIQLWSPARVSPIRTLFGHHGSIISLAFDKDGKQLVSISKDRSLRLWSCP